MKVGELTLFNWHDKYKSHFY